MHLQFALLASHVRTCLDVHLPPKNGKKLIYDTTFLHCPEAGSTSQPALHVTGYEVPLEPEPEPGDVVEET